MNSKTYEDHTPEILIYDPKVDGSYEHITRDEHLSTKEKLLNKIRKAKANAKGNETTFRQPIRTENETK